MTAIVLLSIYCGLLVSVVGCIRRIVQYARTPMHLRWELYPVPHEHPVRAAHGGSYFEKSDWWTTKRTRNVIGELRFMIPEMVFLRGLWDFNRKLWFRSFPFHAGLYLLTAAAVLSAANACVGNRDGMAKFAETAAWIALTLTMLGATALFYRRLTDPELRNFTAAADLFNVGAFAVAAALVMAGELLAPVASVNALAHALVRFDTSLHLPLLTSGGLALGAFMVGYVPFTHMGHFIAKYFTYHAVRWDDAPNLGNRKMAARIAEQLAYRPTWAATHIGADGRRTWAEIAMKNPTATQEVRK